MKLIKKIVLAILPLVFSSYLTPSNALPPSDGWHLLIAPYLWTSAVDGNLNLLGYSKNVHVTFGDIIRHLDFAAQGHVELGYKKFGLLADFTYLDVTDNHRERDIGFLGLNMESTLTDLAFLYRFYTRPVANNGFISVEMVEGGRILTMKNKLNVDRLFNVINSAVVSGPIIGARIQAGLNSRWSTWLRADGGGFDVNHMQSTWSTSIGFSYLFKQHMELAMAYRVVDIHMKKGPMRMNILMNGPAISLAFPF